MNPPPVTVLTGHVELGIILSGSEHGFVLQHILQ
ncbi:unnamed protein product, partial [Rotaria sordida]